ncbi:myosin light chain kinase, smooth muscle [Clupea harengus]|uniref:Myosin light chain kinase, smooth muscle n=1 Tax=Clupea harengus TaxID=7950 RepID=A0A6P8FTY3_CLUHA|nr:myosin light chain kinase, smooth muscle [Clupea harengus]
MGLTAPAAVDTGMRMDGGEGKKRYVSTLHVQLSPRPRTGVTTNNLTMSKNETLDSDFEKMCQMKSKPSPSSSVFSPTSENLNGSRSPLTPLGEGGAARGPVSPVQSPQTGTPARRKEAILKRRSSSGTAPPLQFSTPPAVVEVQVGAEARLTAGFSGSSPVASCWSHNKEEVKDRPGYRVESSDEHSTLLISAARPEDAGLYCILLRDRKGSAQQTLTLSITDRPHPPASCPVVSFSPQGPVLSWSGPSYDGGVAVTGYVVEVKELGPRKSAVWRELTAHCKSTSFRLHSELRRHREYCFRVRVCNVVGVSEPSEESQVFQMDAQEDQQEELPQYVDVTIDTLHKVTDHYNVLEKLGSGKFGQVLRLKHKETGHVYAGKFYKGRREKERQAARREIELMNHLHHPKLVQCLAAYDNKPEVVMVMEFIAGGELFERIVDDSYEHTESTSASYMQQVLEGVQFMHEQSIVHLDLKPENIVCVDKSGTLIKVIDFGLACTLDPSTPLTVMHGTPEFVAPEVINYEPVSLGTDMWSIGVICYILLSGESPFQGSSDAETLALVTAAQWEFDDESFEDISSQAKEFISSLLNKNIRRRMSCEEALAHPWMVSAGAGAAKVLSKNKMKKFLARQKWKKTGKAILALKRMAPKSREGSLSVSSPVEDSAEVLEALERKLHSAPQFSQTLSDLTITAGSAALLTCQITGYPDPEVQWLKGEEVLEEQQSHVTMDYEEDGSCSLRLEKVEGQDFGVYTCRAVNDQGEAVCSATLTVKNRAGR